MTRRKVRCTRCNLVQACFLAASVVCFSTWLMTMTKKRKYCKSKRLGENRKTCAFHSMAGSGRTSWDVSADSRYDQKHGSSGETDLESPQDLNDFNDIDQELKQLMKDTTRQVAANHTIKEKLDKMLDSSSSTDSRSAEVTFDYNELSCTPQQNVLFLKTHKTGSSTLTNILNRYADVRELMVALPAPGLYRFRWPSLFHWTSVDRLLLNGRLANIFSNHARYSRPAMELIMEDNTKYITILRNPIDHFESTFNYMEFYRFFHLPNRTDALEKFLSQPFNYLLDFKERSSEFPESLHLVRNGMLFDLGLQTFYHDNETAVRQAIQKIEQDFSLVLMTDYFDESLVLLKREFCWDLDDILYIKLNQRRSDDKTSKTSKKKMQAAIRRWNWADVLLYERFNQTFWNKVRAHGEEFNNDLADFRTKNREMYQECVAPVEVTETAFGMQGKIKGFKLNGNVSKYNRYLCQKILTNEIDYIEYFRLKFHPHYGYRQQLIKEGLLKPNAPDKLAQRFAALYSGASETEVGKQSSVPRPHNPTIRLGHRRRSAFASFD